MLFTFVKTTTTNKNPNAEINCVVAGGISCEAKRAVKAHTVQHTHEAMEYQNHFVLKLADAAERTIWIGEMRLFGCGSAAGEWGKPIQIGGGARAFSVASILTRFFSSNLPVGWSGDSASAGAEDDSCHIR